MNLNILPAAVTTAKTTASAASGSSSSATASAADASAISDSTATSPADFASQLEAQLGSKLDPKLTSTLAKLGQQISAKGETVDKATLTQAVTTGENDGSLMLDESDLSKMIAAIQVLPNGSLKGSDASAVKNAGLSDKDKDSKTDDANTLPLQALFAQLAAQQQPAQQVQTASAMATQTPSDDATSADKKSSLLSGLTASSLLTGDGKTAVTGQ